MIMAHNSLSLLLTHLCIDHQGKNCNFLSDRGYSSFCHWQHTSIKGTFRSSMFSWVFEIQEHSHDEITGTAADAVVERCFLVLS